MPNNNNKGKNQNEINQNNIVNKNNEGNINNKDNENNESLKFLKDIKNFIVNTSIKFNENNIQFYLVYFTIFFFCYYTLTAKYVNSAFEALYERRKKDKLFLSFYYGGLGFIFLLWCYYFYSISDKLDDMYNRLKIIIFGVFVLFLFFNFTQVFFKYLSIYLPDFVLRVLLYLFLIFNILFFVFYLTMFILNINNKYNVESCLAIELLIFFFIINEANIKYNKSNVYDSLKRYDFSYLTLNCFNKNPNENYKSEERSIQLDNLSKEYGNDYLELYNGIPIKYKNKNSNAYEDLLLCDFYYPGSYNTYLANTPLNGTPDTQAISYAFSEFKVRVVTFDIFSDISNEFSEKANPIVRSVKMKEGSKYLTLDECFETINAHAWIPNNNNEIAYPLFLVLNFNFDDNNIIFYKKIKEKIYQYFQKYFVDKKYGYNGYNGTNFISRAPIRECLGKIIIITNKYPVGPLNELVNCSINKNKLNEEIDKNLKNKENNPPNNSIEINEYKSNYVDFSGVGVSQDYGKTELYKNSKTNIMFFYTNPNKNYENPEQAKAGLFNPRFKDIAQYGIQGTLMHLYLPDNNLNEWYMYFLNKSNFDPVLKAESLRNINIEKDETIGQNPVIGIQKQQKYCLMGNSDYMATNKSNLSTGDTNNSCQAK